ncbi:hypothetical protein H0H87_000156 [Tephrocybe sp. NHM501043]|nr:hypothetical protein H0H87_000156 [Tephrocybe sp. NHM501043]
MAFVDYGSLGFKDIVVTLEGTIVVIVLNRSKQRNSINKNIILELKEAFKLCDRDDRVHAIILTADPTAPAYCSGVRRPHLIRT